MKLKNLIALIIVIVIIGLFGYFVLNGVSIGVYDINPTGNIQMGLDLTGGVYTVYQANDTSVEDFETKMSGAIMVFRNRLDSKGFTEATITRQGTDKIRIDIPINDTSTIQDPTEISEFIGKPAKLEFVDPNGEVVIEGSQIISAKPYVDSSGKYLVSFKLNDEGTKAFADATTEFQGQVIEITLDGETISAPTVESVIPNGEGQITGNFTQEGATELAMQIESGALPLDMTEIEVRSVSASLGDQALQNGILAGIIGVIILFIYMIVFYRLPGLVADIALVGYISITLFLISLFEIQLTLPGIAGIILGIGMAVDANVVIFERFKEEVRAGKSLRASLKAGFSKAFRAIADANVTTIIAAIVLAIFGTGSIKGFAYTLIISIVVSMFSAIVITRFLLTRIVNLNIKNMALYVRLGGKKNNVNQEV